MRLIPKAIRSIRIPQFETILRDAGKGSPFYVRVALFALRKLVKSATDDDVRDLVQGAAGIVGFAKRRASGNAAAALTAADAQLDKMHRELGEART